jgi:hypothetical protein
LGWLGVVWAVGCAHPPPAPEPVAPSLTPSAELQRRFAGTYTYAGGDAERRAVAAAVEKAISGMGFLGKPVARQSLRQRTDIRDSYTLFFAEVGNLRLTTPGYPPEVGPLDGQPFQLETKTGDKTTVTQSFVDGVLVQKGRTDEGSGRTEFRLADEGATLLVHRVMESPQLTAPVDFTLTYRRQ